MKTLKINDKEYNIQYGYRVTWKSGVVKKLVELSDDINTVDRIDKVMSLLPELLLIGLQKHNEEFAFDYDTNAGKEEKIATICDMLDDYFDTEGADFEELLNMLEEELLENGFLASLFRQESQKKTKKK